MAHREHPHFRLSPLQPGRATRRRSLVGPIAVAIALFAGAALALSWLT
jgi:hypothetical protein